MDADDAAFPDWLERSLAAPRLASRCSGSSARACSTSSTTASPASCTCTTPEPRLFRWRALFSAPVFHNTVVARARRCSRRMACATTRRSVSRRTTTSGRAFSRSPKATASRRRSCCTACIRSRPRADAATFSARSRRRSRCGRSRCVAPDLSASVRATLARQVWLGADVAAADVADAATAFVELERTFDAEHAVPTRASSQSCAPRPLGRSPGSRRMRAGRQALSFCARPRGSIRCFPAHVAARVALGAAR